MKFNELMSDVEYSMKESIAYILLGFRKMKKSRGKTLVEYIETVIEMLETIDKKKLIEKMDTELIADFPFHYTLNSKEIVSYAVVLFDILLKANRVINEKNIISELKVVMKLYSTRNVSEKAKNILKKLKESSIRL